FSLCTWLTWFRFLCFFFFFQAEDGIRDDLVTGVQTCALPILSGGTAAVAGPCASTSPPTCNGSCPTGQSCVATPAGCVCELPCRSEERRVGREGGAQGGTEEWREKKCQMVEVSRRRRTVLCRQ